MTEHLTEEQQDDLLIEGSLPAELMAHLATCADCQRERARLTTATAHFNDLGERWARIEAPRRVLVPLRSTPRLGAVGRSWLAVSALCALCLLAVAMASSLIGRYRPAPPLTLAHAPSAGELKMDNRWLESMDHDLQFGPDAVSISASELQAPHTHERVHHSGVTLN